MLLAQISSLEIKALRAVGVACQGHVTMKVLEAEVRALTLLRAPPAQDGGRPEAIDEARPVA